jgi:purine-binding chemotaxis protein CheW
MSEIPEADEQTSLVDLEEFLSFDLAGERYCLEILHVQEIRGWEMVTRVPNQPDYVLGVLNLRGAIVPVYDLRIRLGMPQGIYGKETVVIVIHLKREGKNKSIGIVVDSVSDVIEADPKQLLATPEFGENLDTTVLKGIIPADDNMVMLLDIQQIHPVVEGINEEVSNETAGAR